MSNWTVLQCDGEDGTCTVSADVGFQSSTEARKWAKENGWAVRQEPKDDCGYKDFCPVHKVNVNA